MADVVRIGILGCGNVGSALVRLVESERPAIESRTGLTLEVARVAVRDTARRRDLPLPADRFTADAASVVADPDIDVVVEVMGGLEPARSLITAALAAGKPVVTANKELMADAGAALFAAATASGRDLLFEAAVGGAIPLIRPLRESLAGERIRRVMGIVNGTTNYILTRMAEAGAGYPEALAEATALGYAEADPTADVEGFDAAAKVAIIAGTAFGVEVLPGDVHREGITGLTKADIDDAARFGYVIKLLAVAERPVAGDDQVAVRVHPAMVPRNHPLAAVREAFNAVFIEGDAVGELMLYGRGAGGFPTASAVLGDVVDAAHNLRVGGAGRAPTLTPARLAPMADLVSQYYLSVEVVDRPGVLAAVATVFGDNSVSIRTMVQEGLGGEARLIFTTHMARESDVQATLAGLRALDAVDRIGSLLRVVGPE